MDILKMYGLKILAVMFGIAGLIIYLFASSSNGAITMLAIGGILLFVDTRINTQSLFTQSLNLKSKYSNKNKETKVGDKKKDEK